jgi:hypothetical protein
MREIRPPVGNQHPDVSQEAADKVIYITDTQRQRVCYILSVVGRRGMPANDITYFYNDFFQPQKPIANEMASRLQELRGESKDSRYVIDPPWVEYITDRAPLNDREGMDKQGRLKRVNIHGNFALCQRITREAQYTALATRDGLIVGYGAEKVEQFEESIRRFLGIHGHIRLARKNIRAWRK